MKVQLRSLTIYILSVLVFSLSGCHLFESTTVHKSEIKKASSWSDKDQGPTFESCQGLEGAENQSCFESILSSSILDYFLLNPLESSENIEEEILITLRVDAEGYFSLEDIGSSDRIMETIPNLESSLINAVDQLPKAQPALKTNVGTHVATSFQLPLKIDAQQGD